MDNFQISMPIKKKQMIIWGTGVVAAELFGRIQNEIAFFVDNDERKWGKTFCGKEIRSPSSITEWKDCYLVIAVRNAEGIVEQITEYGMIHFVDYEMYFDSVPPDDFSNAEETIQLYLNKLDHTEEWINSCICLGVDFGAVEGLADYFDHWNRYTDRIKFLHIEEAGKDLSKMTVMALPYFLSDHICSYSHRASNVSDEIVTYIKNKETLYLAAQIMRKKQEKAQPLHEYGCIYYYYIFITRLVRKIKPKCFMIWNAFQAYHAVAAYIGRLYGIPVIHGEFGVLPGTYTFDTMGEMGKSAVACYAKEFKRLPVSKEEYVRAGEIWAYIRESGMNRRHQRNGYMDRVIQKLDNGKATVFIAGQNDETSGMHPYTEDTKEYHSPVFSSSLLSVIEIGKIAEKNNWNVIYKPHPYATFSEKDRSLIPENVILAEGIGINYLISLSDIVVTIVSQTSYMALLHEKPVLMIGYIQLRDKGCTYQAFTKDAIEPELKKAITYGFTDGQKKAFQMHIAQLVKYYLYDDGCERKMRYGRNYPADMADFMSLERELKEMRGKIVS